ncbi:MAG: aldo/keto reductase [Solirubrobacteraceae bacterium]
MPRRDDVRRLGRARPQRVDPDHPRRRGRRQLAQLAEETGIPLVQMAIAFVVRHPAITAAIIGPRTMEHLESQLAAAHVVLADEVLDRIDQINPSGVTINHLDNGWTQPALQPAARRR